jgi:electron transfer flavoprotein alpha subunit
MAQGVVIITEFRDGAFRRVSFEIASEGRRLADELGEPLLAVALGEGIEGTAADLGNYGVEKVYVVDAPALRDYRAETYVPVAAAILQNLEPKVVLTAASVDGKDLSARLAAKLEAGLATDCTELKRPQSQETDVRGQGICLVRVVGGCLAPDGLLPTKCDGLPCPGRFQKG